MLSDVVAGNYVRHPFIAFTMMQSATLMKDPHSLLHYHDPGLLLRYPPAWHNLTNATEGKMMGFDLTVPVGGMASTLSTGPLPCRLPGPTPGGAVLPLRSSSASAFGADGARVGEMQPDGGCGARMCEAQPARVAGTACAAASGPDVLHVCGTAMPPAVPQRHVG